MGIFTAMVGLFGIAGAVGGSRVAAKIKRIPLEAASERYSRQACVVSETLKQTERQAVTRFGNLGTEFQTKCNSIRETLQSTRAGLIEPIATKWSNQLRSLCDGAPEMVEKAICDCEERLARVEQARRARRWFAWLPTRENVRLAVESRMLPLSIWAFRNARAGLELSKGDPSRTWATLGDITRNDPYSLLAPVISAYVKEGSIVAKQMEELNVSCRRDAEKLFGELERERQSAVAQVLSWIRETTMPVLTALQEIETELKREAAALGGTVA